MTKLEAAIERVREFAGSIGPDYGIGDDEQAAIGLVCNAAEGVPALEGEIRRLGQLARPLSEEWPKTTRDAARYRALRVSGMLMLAAEYASAPHGAAELDDLADDLCGRAAETEGNAP